MDCSYVPTSLVIYFSLLSSVHVYLWDCYPVVDGWSVHRCLSLLPPPPCTLALIDDCTLCGIMPFNFQSNREIQSKKEGIPRESESRRVHTSSRTPNRGTPTSFAFLFMLPRALGFSRRALITCPRQFSTTSYVFAGHNKVYLPVMFPRRLGA